MCGGGRGWGQGTGQNRISLLHTALMLLTLLVGREIFVKNELRHKDFHKQNSPLKLALRVYIKGKSGGLITVLL